MLLVLYILSVFSLVSENAFEEAKVINQLDIKKRQ